jgi:multidrug efflux pump subunit AcrA (membrane-fusion protein)
MKHGKRKIGIVIVIIVVILFSTAGTLVAYHQFTDDKKTASAIYRVKSETYASTIEIAGTISAAKEQNLQAAGAGTVTAVYVQEGDTVTKGRIILQMDDSEQRYNLAKHDFDIEQKQITGSPREIELMVTQREVLIQRIKDRQIAANFDGVIAELSASAGDVLEAKDVAGVIVDRTYLAAIVEVVETDAPKLKAGQKVTLTFPANGSDTVEGRVYSFPTVAAKSSRGASVVKAEIRVDNPPDIILPGYSFTGEIEIKPPETLLLVERQAIGYEARGGNPSEVPPRGGLSASGLGEVPPRGGKPASGPGTPTGRLPEGGPGEAPPVGGLPASGLGERRGRGAFAEKILSDKTTERVAVQVRPYGEEFVQILDGLSEGDELTAQETQRPSGWNKTAQSATQSRIGQNSERQERNNTMMPMMPGAPSMGGGGGPGGPPRQ